MLTAWKVYVKRARQTPVNYWEMQAYLLLSSHQSPLWPTYPCLAESLHSQNEDGKQWTRNIIQGYHAFRMSTSVYTKLAPGPPSLSDNTQDNYSYQRKAEWLRSFFPGPWTQVLIPAAVPGHCKSLSSLPEVFTGDHWGNVAKL